MGQNIAPNPDLEFYSNCPTGPSPFGQNPPLPCLPWDAATYGSSDYFNACSNPGPVGVPSNGQGWQLARSGQGYAGLILKGVYSGGLDYREYLQAPLITSLTAGKYYYTRFYVSLSNTSCGIQQIGAYFSPTPIQFAWGDALPISNVTPQVESNGTFLNDTANWILVEGCFRAAGGEAYVILGNFHTNADTPIDPTCVVSADSYYYIDDIYISEVQPGGIAVNLGNDTTTCYSITLDPGMAGVDYYWSNGSTDSTINVTISGNYAVTVYDGCLAGVDTIHVDITNQAPVEISPSSFNLCAGGSLLVQLDPNAGNYLWDDGSTSNNYTINSPGTYTVSLNDGCDVTSDSIAVNILDPPAPFSIGDDTLLCTGSQIVITLDPSLGNFTWQNGSNSNSFTITDPGLYIVTISNPCGETSASLSVEEIAPEVLLLPVSTYALCNGQTLEISLDTTLGPYVWQDGSISSDYIITTSGLYSVTMSHYCGQSSDSVLVTTYNTPVVDLGDTILQCPGDTLILTQPGVLGSYTWQDGSTNDSLIVTSSGTYGLSVGNVCGIDFDAVTVIFENILIPSNLGPDIHLCPGDSIVLHATNSNAQFLWQDNSNVDSLIVDAAGTYYITEFNSCLSFSDTIEVAIENQAPSLALPNQITLCNGVTDTLEAGVGGVTYLWSDGSQNSNLIISNPGTYSLTVSSACGSDRDTVIVIDGGSAPTVSLGVDTSICPGELIIIQPNSTDVSNWLWSDGSTGTSLIVSDSGTIDVYVSNACGMAHDTMEVVLLDPVPALNLGLDTSLCSGESITLSITIPAVDIEWSDGSGNNDLVINSAGTYFASISNACGNASDTIEVIQLPDIPPLDLGPDIPLCPGEQTTLSPGIGGVDYLWQDGSTGNSYFVDHDQLVVLTISNACGIETDSLNVILNTAGPDVDLGPDFFGCEGDTIQLASNIANVNFLWQDGSTNSTFTAYSSGQYYLQVINACGTDTDTVNVDIHGTIPQPDLGGDTVLCEGTTLLLTSNADAETTSMWQNGSSQSSFMVNAPGIYILSQENHCGESEDSIFVVYQPLPVAVDLGNDTILCPGETLLLIAPTTPDPISWQDGSNGPSLLVTQAGTYSLSVTNYCGTRSDEIEINYDNQFPQFPEDLVYEICPGNSIEMDVLQNFPATYQWNTGSTEASISITTPNIYTVTVISNCQQATYEIEVTLDENCNERGEFFIPNIISPNDDNINDVFTINPGPDVEINTIEGSIFNRWGNLVFNSNENPFTWNGQYAGEDVNPGVYVYAIVVTYTIHGREVEKSLTGDLTVIK